ncbi:hypothetical protein NPIL_524171 [Nephila pilipes]|uniref:Uncharacterized protein n=1 Tax=Nephila pilipes TaxID=299642 RepID=A0A8X6UUR7_NEPPI|nr:hypothetical protein NPIL_524171 [Nephila pilipes]
MDRLKNSASGSSLAPDYGSVNAAISDFKKNSDTIKNLRVYVTVKMGPYLEKRRNFWKSGIQTFQFIYPWFIRLHSYEQPVNGPLICENALEAIEL